jgi:hypothetical protein
MTKYLGDGVPDRLVKTSPADSMMRVVFYKRPILNEQKSAEIGRPWHDDVVYVKIKQQPGERDEVDRPAQDRDKMRWPAQWYAYAAGEDQVAEGTPLAMLFPRHPAAIATLQSLGFYTAEQLVNASATASAAIGILGQDYVDFARKYLSDPTSGAAFHQVELENEQVKRDNDRMAKKIEELTAQVQQISAAMMANAAVGVPMKRMQPEIPTMPPAQPIPVARPLEIAFPRPPSFANSAVVDVQSAMINEHHGSTPKGRSRKTGDAA